MWGIYAHSISIHLCLLRETGLATKVRMFVIQQQPMIVSSGKTHTPNATVIVQNGKPLEQHQAALLFRFHVRTRRAIYLMMISGWAEICTDQLGQLILINWTNSVRDYVFVLLTPVYFFCCTNG